MVSVFSGGNQSVLSATVSGDPSHRREEVEEEKWSVSVVVENELGNSSEIVVVWQSEVEWVGALYRAAYTTRSPHCHSHMYSLSHLHAPQVSLRHQVSLRP